MSFFDAIRRGDVEAVRASLAAGANPRLSDGSESVLHAAARTGSVAMVEALLEGGALEWQRDDAGRTPDARNAARRRAAFTSRPYRRSGSVSQGEAT